MATFELIYEDSFRYALDEMDNGRQEQLAAIFITLAQHGTVNLDPSKYLWEYDAGGNVFAFEYVDDPRWKIVCYREASEIHVLATEPSLRQRLPPKRAFEAT